MKKWMLAAGAVTMVGLVGCAQQEFDLSVLKAKINDVEGDDFGTCMAESYRSAVQLEMAKKDLASLEAGSNSQMDWDDGNRAADAAAAHKIKAANACDNLQKPLRARVAQLEAETDDLDARLTRLEQLRETLRGVTFATGSAQLTGAARSVLDVVANRLLRQPAKIEIAGHASATGSPEMNMKLSQRRAESVKAYLVSKGVPADQIMARGYGITQPIASNNTEQGRQANQRIEIAFIK